MATALAKGFVAARLVVGSNLVAFDPVAAAGQTFQAAVPGAKLAESNREVVTQASLIFLAVKPQHMSEVLSDAKFVASKEKLFVSIAAGVTLARLSAGLGTDRVIRVMPN